MNKLMFGVAFKQYVINEYGEVYNAKTNKKLKGCLNKKGYLAYTIRPHEAGRKAKTITAHRLVALLFIPNPEGKEQVNHKDGNKLNNHVSNLEWCTLQENIAHAVANNLQAQGVQKPLAKLTEADVLKIRELYAEGFNQTQIAKLYPVTARNIGDIVRRVNWRHI